MTNQTARVLELLKRFNDGKKVCIEALQNEVLWEGKSEKTIRRDLDVIKEYFPESFELVRGGKGEKGCYKAITRETFDNFINPDMLSLLIQTFNIAQRSELFDSFNFDESDKRIIHSKLKETNSVYEFKNKPFETKKDDMLIFKKLESAIKYQKYIKVNYQAPTENFNYEIKPYKIIFMNEIFYLACTIEESDFEFSLLRISRIESIEDTRKTYQKNYDLEEFIKYMQTPFATYTPNFKSNLIEVLLEVDVSKAHFFKAKKFLTSQKIIETKPNGNLILSYQVTQIIEMDELIKKWLPSLKVISPISLKQKIEDDICAYLE
jgi:predicted DNA-binding transcriptional regulator YafY